MLAIDEDLPAALRIFRRGVAPANQLLCPWGEKLEIGEVAIQHRQLFYVCLAEFHVNISAIGLQLRHFTSDFNGLSHRANLQLSINVGRVVS